jgi:hypothetical protein
MAAPRIRVLLVALGALAGCGALAAPVALAGPGSEPVFVSNVRAAHAHAHAHGRTVNGIATSARPTTVAYRAKTVISGTLHASTGESVSGELLELQRDQAPAGRFLNIAHTVTDRHGRYRFPAIRVERDARFRVADEGMGGRTGPVVAVVLEAPVYPSAARVLAAERYLATRVGFTAFAVLDSHGNLSGSDIRRRFHTASIVKSMLLVAYLRMLAAQGRSLDGASTALLYPMIHESSNQAASAVLAIVGQAALDRVAADAHMTDFEPAAGWWAFTEVSAADLARFFSVQDSLIPSRFDAYARALLSGIEPSQSWGIPAVARPEFEVFFKGGWLPESEGLVNQAARLEHPPNSFSLAILTVENPPAREEPPSITEAKRAMRYGEETIEGVTARLLGRAV